VDSPLDPTDLARTILFAEDEPLLVDLMQRLLIREGFKVLVAKDGVEAVQLHRQHKDEIAMAILDTGLPKLKGYEAIQRMKRDNANLKAVLASGYISHEAESLVAKGELAGVLHKPYSAEQVLAIVRQTLQQR